VADKQVSEACHKVQNIGGKDQAAYGDVKADLKKAV
jgi:hypothetical protein